MISVNGLVARLTLRLESYMNLIVVPLAVYYTAIAGGYRGQKLKLLILASAIAAVLSALFGLLMRIYKLKPLIEAVNAGQETVDYAALKLKILFYPQVDSFIMGMRWLFIVIFTYAMLWFLVPISWLERLPIVLTLFVCAPIGGIIAFCTTEHLLEPVFMDERIRMVSISLPRYVRLKVSFRTTVDILCFLVIPFVTLGHLLLLSNHVGQHVPNLSIHVTILLLLSLSAILIALHESNANIRSGLKLTVNNLEELERGNLDVNPIPVLTKGEIGIISQSVNVLAKSLRGSREMFVKAFRSSPVGIVIWRIADGRILDVNESFLKISGFPRDALVDKSMREVELFPTPDGYARMTDILAGSEEVRGFETEIRTHAQELRLVAVSSEVVMLGDDPCIIATIEDVTEKRTLEREIMTIGELERLKIGQDLHDDIGPHLIGIEMLTGLLNQKLEKGIMPSLSEAEKIRSLIDEAIGKTRRLSRGLCPVFLADQGLESLLQEMASNIQEVYSITCILHYQESILVDDINVCTHIYYIVNEAIHNAIRHGHADRIIIGLSRHDEHITVVIADNGVGIPKDDAPQGMGLKIMKFRARMIGADINIQNNLGQGALVMLSFMQAGKRLAQTGG